MTSFPVVLGVVVGGVVDVVVVRLGRSLNGSTLSSTAIKETFFEEKDFKIHDTLQDTRCSPENPPPPNNDNFFASIFAFSLIISKLHYFYDEVFTIYKN